MKIHIIYTDSDMLLSKKSYTAWREVQDEYEGYKSSLGPWTVEEVIEYLAAEYSNLEPSAQEQLSALVSGLDEVRKLSFRSKK